MCVPLSSRLLHERCEKQPVDAGVVRILLTKRKGMGAWRRRLASVRGRGWQWKRTGGLKFGSNNVSLRTKKLIDIAGLFLFTQKPWQGSK